jgi:hypothetical protein
MNVLKPHLKATVRTLLDKGVSQREINRKTGIDRKTIRSYDRLDHLSADQEGWKSPTGKEVATGIEAGSVQIPHPGHRLWRKNCRSTLAVPASHIESGLRNK